MLTRWIAKDIARLLALLLFGLGLVAQVGCAGGQTLTEEQRAQQIAAFDQVWTTVEANHWDRELVETEWVAARDRLRPRLETVQTEADARAVTDELVASLGQSHFGVIPKAVYERVETEGGEGETGLWIRLRDKEALVVRVRPDSPAYEAGIRPGDVIVGVRGRDVSELIVASGEAAEYGVMRADTTFAGAIQNATSGAVGEFVGLTVRGPDGAERDVSVGLIEPEGEKSGFGNLPAQHVYCEARTLEGGVGYFYLSEFFAPQLIMPQWQAFIAENADAPGIVLDLRNNPGGIIPMSTGVGGFLITGQGERLGEMTTRDSQLKLVINPRQGAYTGPVAVLIDEMSASNSEILSGGLQGLGRARVFGRRTAGVVLPARVETLPTGDGFIYAFADYVSVSGERLEGEGVSPDVPIDETVEMFASSKDPVLDAATAWILSGGTDG